MCKLIWYKYTGLDISSSPVAQKQIKVWFGLVNVVSYLADWTSEQNK